MMGGAIGESRAGAGGLMVRREGSRADTRSAPTNATRSDRMDLGREGCRRLEERKMPWRDLSMRRSMRLAGWDYRSPGPYGITLVTQHREWFFGEIVDGQMVHNAAGRMAEAVWQRMAQQFPRIMLDAFVVMPNHLHAIIWMSDLGPDGNPTLGDVVQRFKAFTTTEYSDGVHEHGWVPYDRRLWKREYFDKIIRSKEQLINARTYIAANPANWPCDPDREPIRPASSNQPS
jgi:putative transposase